MAVINKHYTDLLTYDILKEYKCAYLGAPSLYMETHWLTNGYTYSIPKHKLKDKPERYVCHDLSYYCKKCNRNVEDSRTHVCK